jgi:hypothetical protein
VDWIMATSQCSPILWQFSTPCFFSPV